MGTIISDWGGIFELEIDRKARIMARVSRKPNIYIYIYTRPYFYPSITKDKPILTTRTNIKLYY
jgi:hypothetical protein